MDIRVVTRTVNTLKLHIQQTTTKAKITDESEIFICSLVKFQLRLSGTRIDQDIFARFTKAQNDTLTYTCNVNVCHPRKYNIVFKENNLWVPLSDMRYKCKNGHGKKIQFTIAVHIDHAECASPHKSLYDDTDLLDFELRGTDGSVNVHKTILASYSPVLKTMLSGEWKESREGNISLQGVTKETLQHLKDYMYLQTLPDSGLEPLLLLGSYYLMPELVQKCSIKLLNNLSADNFLQSMEFAGKYKITNLISEIVNCAPFLKVTDRKYSWLTVCAVTNSSLTEQE